MDILWNSEPINESVKLQLNLNITIDTDTNTGPNWRKTWKSQSSSLEKVCNTVPNYDMKTILGDLNAKGGKTESYLYPACGGHRLQNKWQWKTNGKSVTGKRFNCDGNMVST